jgi:uncharacterized membrane protein YphA (DoxX/SURF4 family)
MYPGLFSYGILAPTILRIVAGFIFLSFAYRAFISRKERSVFAHVRKGAYEKFLLWVRIVIEFFGGLLLLFGLFTQLAAMILSLVTLVAIAVKARNPRLLRNGLGFFILLLVVLLSLIVLGPGIWAFDLPL